MTISFFLFKNRKKLLIYLIGLTLVFTLLYFLILRHSGYIYYWDLSGAFDFRDPFGQYFKIYTPWDGNNIGVRNRLPLVSIIWLISQPFLLLGFGNEIVIKIAVTLLFLGGYTVMYYLAPKFIKMFCRPDVEKQGGINVWALIVGLLYMFIPFYVYRVSQLHLFYMSVFYPLHVYLFIRLFESKTINPKYLALFVISMFFGLTSPNIIIFELFTFAILGVFLLFQKFKERADFKILITNMLLAGIFVLVTNIYWVYPYFLQGSPEPGYVINTTMISLLSQGVTLQNFLLGQSDWFINQAKLGVLDSEESTISTLQIFGAFVFYITALVGYLRYVKGKYKLPILILLLLAPVLLFPVVPLQSELQEKLLFSSLGWIFREVNRISFFWFFWTYILFLIGSYGIYESILLDGKLNKLLKVVILPAIFIPVLIFMLPVNIKFFSYLKPIDVAPEIKEVFQIMEDDSDYFSVLYYPNVDAYAIPWKKEKFFIADAEEYKFLAYNSPKPPVGISSVIPNSKTYQAHLTEYFVQNRELHSNISDYFSNIGIKYVVLRKAAEPISLGIDHVRAEVVYPFYLYLEQREEFKIVLENEYYTVFENLSFKGTLRNRYNDLYTTTSFNILEHISPNVISKFNVRFCNFSENYDDCFIPSSFQKVFLKYESDEFFKLEFLTREEKEKYGVYPYDHTPVHGIGVDWGRASYYDRVNGELHNVLRRYRINGWDFEIMDKVAYSDKPYLQREKGYSSTLSFSENISCIGECEVYAYILQNHLGNNLSIQLNETRYDVNTNSKFEVFRWKKLGDISIEDSLLNVEITNRNGFAGIGGILLLPREIQTTLEQRTSDILFVNVSETDTLSLNDIIVAPEKCSFDSTVYSKGTISTQTDCSNIDNIYITNYHENTISSVKGNNLLEITLNNFKNIYLTILFLISVVFVASIPILLLSISSTSSRKRRH